MNNLKKNITNQITINLKNKGFSVVRKNELSFSKKVIVFKYR
jgi:hypothetical protein